MFFLRRNRKFLSFSLWAIKRYWAKDRSRFLLIPEDRLCRRSFSGGNYPKEVEKRCPYCLKEFINEKILNLHLARFHSSLLTKILMDRPLETYLKIFGSGYKRKTESTLRYPNGLIVTLSGNRRGNWYSFTENVGGGPLRAIQFRYPELSYAEVLKEAEKISKTDISGESSEEPYIHLISKNASSYSEQRIKVANEIWNITDNLLNTEGAYYLTKIRRIPESVISRLEFRFLKRNKIYNDFDEETEEFVPIRVVNPTIVVPVRDCKGTLTGVHRIILYKNEKKKLSKGLIHGAAGIVQNGSCNKLILTEGPETGASVAAGVPDITVLASLSVGNFLNVSELILESYSHCKDDVFIAADNDGEESSTFQTTHKAAKIMREKGIRVKVIFPTSIPGLAKTDWNDVLVHQGLDALQKQISL